MALSKGFKIHKCKQSHAADVDTDVRSLAITDTVPFSILEHCPCCLAVDFSILAALISDSGKKIRIGVCNKCGYVGYLDRPTEKWMEEYYTKIWDNAEIRDLEHELRSPLASKLSGEQRDVFEMLMTLSPDKNRAVCDVGCGKGGVLLEFRERVFSTLFGVEHSEYRANFTRKKHGFPVISGAFESGAVTRELRTHAPFGIINFSHVLEHIYNPEIALRQCAELQEEGDYIVIAVPHGEKEVPPYVLWWLPHLHSFNLTSLQHLLSRCGYSVVISNETPTGLAVIARRTRLSHSRPELPPLNFLAIQVDRFRSWFRFDLMKPRKKYLFAWEKNGRMHLLSPFYADIQSLYHELKNFIRRHVFKLPTGRLFAQFIVTTLDQEKMPDAAFEIHYVGPITFLIR